ncbi:hypothetical protein A0H81_08970 [Grifola frondosa]|uniref:Protein kinase domain-containing protein n=1 Tax=Grifola frondosa TaxID=5627 RepID=A0A1C7M5F3_GRIFR|nr:hypothetical protein A0H81_08970 [Grifola frondosa]
MLVYGRRMKRIRREARFYANELQKLQGRMLPRFHGLFMGEMQDGDSVCLVLDYIVGTLPGFNNTTYRTATWDFVENKIDRPYIINFGWAERHVCQKFMPIVSNTEEPEWKEFHCDELHDAYTEAQGWLPRTVVYLRRKVTVPSWRTQLKNW